MSIFIKCEECMNVVDTAKYPMEYLCEDCKEYYRASQEVFSEIVTENEYAISF